MPCLNCYPSWIFAEQKRGGAQWANSEKLCNKYVDDKIVLFVESTSIEEKCPLLSCLLLKNAIPEFFKFNL